jgi:hypothetical protein
MNTSQLSPTKLRRAVLMAAGTAALVNGALYFVGHRTGLLDGAVLVPGQNQPISLAPVLISSIVPTLLAGGVLALLNRFTRRPLALFTVLSLVLLVLSFANPLRGPSQRLARHGLVAQLHARGGGGFAAVLCPADAASRHPILG